MSLALLLVAGAILLVRLFVAKATKEEGPSRAVLPPDPSEPPERRLEEAIRRYAGRGYILTHRSAKTAQLVRPKRFSLFFALLWFLLFGVGVFVYLLYYLAKKDRGAYLEALPDGSVRATEQIVHPL